MADNPMDKIWSILRPIDFEIDEEINDDFVCTICHKLMLNVHSGPCGCTYCLKCIRNYLGSGEKLCPGEMDECKSVLLNFESNVCIDQRLNMKILKLMAKCSHASCEYRAQLKSIPNHVRMLHRQSLYIKCPYCNIGCKTSEMISDEMGDHLHLEMFSHSTLAVQWMNNSANETALLRQEVENMRNENVCLTGKVTALEANHDETRDQIEELGNQLLQKDVEIDRLIENCQRFEIELESIRQDRQRNKIELDRAMGRTLVLETQFNSMIEEKKKRKLTKMKIEEMTEICAEYLWSGEEWNQFAVGNAAEFHHSHTFSKTFITMDGYKLCLRLECGYRNINISPCIMSDPSNSRLEWPFIHLIVMEVINVDTEKILKTKILKYDPKEKSSRDKPRNGQKNIIEDFLRFNITEMNFIDLCNVNQLNIKCTVLRTI